MKCLTRECLLLLLCWVLTTLAEYILPASHFTLRRRGDQLADQQDVNLTRLVDLVQQAERRFDTSTRTVKGNKVTRAWKANGNGFHQPDELFADIGGLESWFANVRIGDPPQKLEFDLNMLLPDFFLLSTTGIDHIGSKYDSFASRSHAGSQDRVHPECRLPTDLLYLTNITLSTSVPLHIPMCGPPKYTRRTLIPSGNVLGLAPSNALAQTTHPSFVEMLHGILPEKIWSIILTDAKSGVLSMGSTIAPHLEEAKVRSQVELQRMGQPGLDAKDIDQEVQSHLEAVEPKDWHDYFRWSDVKGSSTWWTTLLQGVWINGAKVLKNQPVLFDVQVPFILAPPLAAWKFYEGISGSKRLEKPFDMFFAFPCLNQPYIAFEFDGWIFPILTGEESRMERTHRSSGAKFSLGKEKLGSGYCIGVVVETRMGVRNEEGKYGRKTSDAAGNGMRDFWVVGEPFFHGMGLVFDIGEQKIGFRSL